MRVRANLVPNTRVAWISARQKSRAASASYELVVILSERHGARHFAWFAIPRDYDVQVGQHRKHCRVESEIRPAASGMRRSFTVAGQERQTVSEESKRCRMSVNRHSYPARSWLTKTPKRRSSAISSVNAAPMPITILPMT